MTVTRAQRYLTLLVVAPALAAGVATSASASGMVPDAPREVTAAALSPSEVERLVAERADELALQAARIAAGSKADKRATADAADFLMPTAGAMTSGWGLRMHPILGYVRLHDGQDIGGVCGQDVYAARSGTVTRAASGYNGGSGNNVRIDAGQINGKRIETGYLHLNRFIVTVGQRVTKGQVIGYVGSTGLSTACHLHFSVYENGIGVDPASYLHNAVPTTLTAEQLRAAQQHAVPEAAKPAATTTTAKPTVQPSQSTTPSPTPKPTVKPTPQPSPTASSQPPSPSASASATATQSTPAEASPSGG